MTLSIVLSSPCQGLLQRAKADILGDIVLGCGNTFRGYINPFGVEFAGTDRWTRFHQRYQVSLNSLQDLPRPIHQRRHNSLR